MYILPGPFSWTSGMWKSLQQLHIFSLQTQYLLTLSVACFSDGSGKPRLLCLRFFAACSEPGVGDSSRSVKKVSIKI